MVVVTNGNIGATRISVESEMLTDMSDIVIPLTNKGGG